MVYFVFVSGYWHRAPNALGISRVIGESHLIKKKNRPEGGCLALRKINQVNLKNV